MVFVYIPLFGTFFHFSTSVLLSDFRRPCDSICDHGMAPIPGCDASCTPNSSTEIYPAHSRCIEKRGTSQGTVVCDKCFVSLGRKCARAMGNLTKSRGDFCTEECQCDTGASLHCNSVCTCAGSAYRYDASGKCVKREFGDPCSKNDDCKVYGGMTEGFTYSGGVCKGGMCQCDEDNGYVPTVTSFINGTSGLLFSKKICVTGMAAVDLPLGKICSLEPIGDSEDPATRVCAANSVCFTCPEEEFSSATSNEGKCRKFRMAFTNQNF